MQVRRFWVFCLFVLLLIIYLVLVFSLMGRLLYTIVTFVATVYFLTCNRVVCRDLSNREWVYSHAAEVSSVSMWTPEALLPLKHQMHNASATQCAHTVLSEKSQSQIVSLHLTGDNHPDISHQSNVDLPRWDKMKQQALIMQCTLSCLLVIDRGGHLRWTWFAKYNHSMQRCGISLMSWGKAG